MSECRLFSFEYHVTHPNDPSKYRLAMQIRSRNPRHIAAGVLEGPACVENGCSFAADCLELKVYVRF